MGSSVDNEWKTQLLASLSKSVRFDAERASRAKRIAAGLCAFTDCRRSPEVRIGDVPTLCLEHARAWRRECLERNPHRLGVPHDAPLTQVELARQTRKIDAKILDIQLHEYACKIRARATGGSATSIKK